MFRRQRVGSVVCSCGRLVGVQDERCLNCGRWNPGLWGFAPALRRFGNDLGFVELVSGACIFLFLAELGLSQYLAATGVIPSGIGTAGLFGFLSPHPIVSVVFGAAGAVPVIEEGRWWTLLSAGWLHGGLLHITFNLMAIRQLAPPCAELYGAARTIIIYSLSSVTAFLLSSLVGSVFGGVPIIGGAAYTLGASGSLCGLLGAILHYGERGGSRFIRSQIGGYAVGLLMMGILMPGIDNMAHAGGFAGGYLVGKWLDPLRAERLDHILLAIVCLAASAFAILGSVLYGLRFR
jgi:rhomboid protease GluP